MDFFKEVFKLNGFFNSLRLIDIFNFVRRKKNDWLSFEGLRNYGVTQIKNIP